MSEQDPTIETVAADAKALREKLEAADAAKNDERFFTVIEDMAKAFNRQADAFELIAERLMQIMEQGIGSRVVK